MSKRLDELLAMADGEDKRGVCPPYNKLTEEQRNALARVAILGASLTQHPLSYAEAMMTLAMTLPKNAAPLPVELQIAEANRQAYAIAADLLRLFPKEGL